MDGNLIAYPFYESNTDAVSKSGLTFNHKRLWKELRISNKPYNYYPRGRVDFTNKGKAVIYMNPNITDTYIAEIKSEFGLRGDVKVFKDGSDHYKCYTDEDWNPDLR